MNKQKSLFGAIILTMTLTLLAVSAAGNYMFASGIVRLPEEHGYAQKDISDVDNYIAQVAAAGPLKQKH